MFLSIWTNYFKDVSLKDAVSSISAAGFNYAELASLNLQDTEIATIKTFCDATNIKLHQAHGKFGFKKGFLDAGCDFDDYSREIDIASKLGIETVVYHPICPGINEKTSIVSYNKLFHDNVAFFSKLIPLLEKRRVKIALENMPFGAYIYAEELLELLSALDSECFGICLDTSHIQYSGQNMSRFIMQAEKHIIATHMSDSLQGRDLHLMPLFGASYDGWVDWYKVRDDLRSVGYAGAFNLEVPGEGFSSPLWLREKKIKFAHDYLSKYLFDVIQS